MAHNGEKGRMHELKPTIPDPLKKRLDEIQAKTGQPYTEIVKSALKFWIAGDKIVDEGGQVLVRRPGGEVVEVKIDDTSF